MSEHRDSRARARKYVREITSIVRDLGEAISLMYNAFVHGKKAFLLEASDLIDSARHAIVRIGEEFPPEGHDDAVNFVYSSMVPNLKSIVENLSSVCRGLDSKIKEEVLFSDKAVAELNYLFQRTRELLSTTEDLILARNVYVSNYLREATLELERTADTFVSLHEDRLIGGLCLPKASGIFIGCVDSFKHIAWQVREIAGKMGGE